MPDAMAAMKAANARTAGGDGTFDLTDIVRDAMAPRPGLDPIRLLMEVIAPLVEEGAVDALGGTWELTDIPVDGRELYARMKLAYAIVKGLGL